jgi:hypothetical protein
MPTVHPWRTDTSPAMAQAYPPESHLCSGVKTKSDPMPAATNRVLAKF